MLVRRADLLEGHRRQVGLRQWVHMAILHQRGTIRTRRPTGAPLATTRRRRRQVATTVLQGIRRQLTRRQLVTRLVRLVVITADRLHQAATTALRLMEPPRLRRGRRAVSRSGRCQLRRTITNHGQLLREQLEAATLTQEERISAVAILMQVLQRWEIPVATTATVKKRIKVGMPPPEISTNVRTRSTIAPLELPATGHRLMTVGVERLLGSHRVLGNVARTRVTQRVTIAAQHPQLKGHMEHRRLHLGTRTIVRRAITLECMLVMPGTSRIETNREGVPDPSLVWQ